MQAGSSPPLGHEELLQAVSVQILNSLRVEIGREWSLDLCSPFWRLYVNNRSGAWISASGRRSLLEAGAVWIIPAWVRFQTGLSRPVRQDFLHFHLTGFPPSLLKKLFPRPVHLTSTPLLRALCRSWQRGFRVPSNLAHFCHAGALAQHGVAEMWERTGGSESWTSLQWLADSQGLQPALRTIDQRPSDPPANAELARLCALGEDHFIRKFHRVIGLTPACYGRERRLTLAAEWLTTSQRTLEEIAAAAGFTDRFHFSRAFKAKLGVPPAAYRRLHILPPPLEG